MEVPKEFYLPLQWRKTSDAEYPFIANDKKYSYRIRVNDFPEEPLFSLLKEDTPLCSFNSWPDHWEKKQ
jgi:hypothetical protein